MLTRIQQYRKYVGDDAIKDWLKFTGWAVMQGAGPLLWAAVNVVHIAAFFSGMREPLFGSFYAEGFLYPWYAWFFIWMWRKFRHAANQATSLYWLNEVKFYLKLGEKVGIDPRKRKEFKRVVARALYYVEQVARYDLCRGRFKNPNGGELARQQAVQTIESLERLLKY